MCTPELVDALFEAALDPPEPDGKLTCDNCGRVIRGLPYDGELPFRILDTMICEKCAWPPLAGRNQDTAILYWAVMIELGSSGFLPDSDAINRQDELEAQPRWG